MSFAEKLEFFLKEKKISKTQLLSDLKLGKNQFTYWKKTGSIPNGFTVQAIADYLKIPMSGLIDQKEKPSASGELPDKNVVTIIGRDGRYIQKKLTDEQIRALETIIDQMPDAPDDI